MAHISLKTACLEASKLGVTSLVTSDWFTVIKCYSENDIRVMDSYLKEELKLTDDEHKIAIIGFYYIIYKGIIPSEWPASTGIVLWQYIYYHAKQTNGELMFKDGIIEEMTPKTIFEATPIYTMFVNAIKAVAVKIKNETNIDTIVTKITESMFVSKQD